MHPSKTVPIVIATQKRFKNLWTENYSPTFLSDAIFSTSVASFTNERHTSSTCKETLLPPVKYHMCQQLQRGNERPYETAEDCAQKELQESLVKRTRKHDVDFFAFSESNVLHVNQQLLPINQLISSPPSLNYLKRNDSTILLNSRNKEAIKLTGDSCVASFYKNIRHQSNFPHKQIDANYLSLSPTYSFENIIVNKPPLHNKCDTYAKLNNGQIKATSQLTFSSRTTVPPSKPNSEVQNNVWNHKISRQSQNWRFLMLTQEKDFLNNIPYTLETNRKQYIEDMGQMLNKANVMLRENEKSITKDQEDRLSLAQNKRDQTIIIGINPLNTFTSDILLNGRQGDILLN